MKNDAKRDTLAYKGYLIKTHPTNDTVWIEAGGHLVCWAKSVEEAKATIDRDLT